MSLNRSLDNIVVGFDLEKCNVRIFHNLGDDYTLFDINEFHYSSEMMGSDLISDLLSSALGSYLKNKKYELPDVYIVLPDSLVNIETIVVPVMQENKMKDALKSELKKLYSNFTSLETSQSINNKNKKQAVYTVSMVDKSVIVACQNVCKKFSLDLKNISFSSNAIINSFFGLSGKSKHSNFIFANFYDECTKLIYVSHDKTTKIMQLPFSVKNGGQKIYDVNKLDNESSNYLEYTTFAGVNGSLVNFSYGDDIMKAFRKEQADKKSMLIEKQNQVDELLGKVADVKSYNFDVFVRYIDIFVNDVCSSGFAKPDSIIINSTEDYSEEFEKVNNEYKIYQVESQIITNQELLNNLDLYGMVYAVIYNKGLNFVDKEEQSIIGRITTYFSFLFRRIKKLLNKHKKEGKGGK